MSKGKHRKSRTVSVGVSSRPSKPRKPRIPAEIKAYSGSGFHAPGKYGNAERRAARRQIDSERS